MASVAIMRNSATNLSPTDDAYQGWASQVVKNPPASAGGGNGSPLQYSWLENSVDGGAGLSAHTPCIIRGPYPVCVLSHLRRVLFFATLWTAARQALVSVGFSRVRIQEWVVISFSRGIFLIQGSNLGLLCLLR